MSTAGDDESMRDLLEAIFERYQYDFRRYAMASLRRRLQAACSHFGNPPLTALKAKVLADPQAFTELLRYLTVQVSDLFRDPAYFRSVREQVVPYLRTYPSLKLWVAGCATGEEAYSFAIMLAEEGLLDRTLVYATDIHADSLRVAESGVYALDRFARFSENYRLAGGRRSLSDYYTAEYSSAVLSRTLRKSILFSDHSLATDTVFAEMELVSCRNVLIYFERELQDRALEIIKDSLGHRGFLGLGHRETLRFSKHAAAFTEFVRADRIYRKV